MLPPNHCKGAKTITSSRKVNILMTIWCILDATELVMTYPALHIHNVWVTCVCLIWLHWHLFLLLSASQREQRHVDDASYGVAVYCFRWEVMPQSTDGCELRARLRWIGWLVTYILLCNLFSRLHTDMVCNLFSLAQTATQLQWRITRGWTYHYLTLTCLMKHQTGCTSRIATMHNATKILT